MPNKKCQKSGRLGKYDYINVIHSLLSKQVTSYQLGEFPNVNKKGLFIHLLTFWSDFGGMGKKGA